MPPKRGGKAKPPALPPKRPTAGKKHTKPHQRRKQHRKHRYGVNVKRKNHTGNYQSNKQQRKYYYQLLHFFAPFLLRFFLALGGFNALGMFGQIRRRGRDNPREKYGIYPPPKRGGRAKPPALPSKRPTKTGAKATSFSLVSAPLSSDE